MRAVESATWGDFPVFRAVMMWPTFGRLGRPRDGLVFASFLGTGPALARTDDEIVFGWIACRQLRRGGTPLVAAAPHTYADFTEARCVKMAFNFRYCDGELSTETRVLATDAAGARLFRLYWLLVRLPGGLLRREWLRGIRRRATRLT